MFIDKYKYEFLGRMRRPEGLPPRFEKNYRVHLGASPTTVTEISLMVSLALVIGIFKFAPSPSSKPVVRVTAQEVVQIEDVEITRQEDRPPPPPKPPVVIEAPQDEVLADVPLDLNTEIRASDTVAPPTPKPQQEDEEEYFMAVEEMPQLVGGMTALMKNLEYPELAVRAGIQGRVYILAFVNEQGDVVRAEVLKGIGGGCDEAALAAVKKAKFIPGKQRGKPVKTRISIPVEFKLTH
ncbi:MAG TPA: energy transducer TonB [Bacteroidota bacterium]|nr:energy transducer TonB [Bacteroidota bacterium]